jgi:hypothetical protein
MLNCYCRERLIFYAFWGTDIMAGAQYATFIILWRNKYRFHEVIFTEWLNEYDIQILYLPLLNWSARTATASECSVLSASHERTY